MRITRKIGRVTKFAQLPSPMTSCFRSKFSAIPPRIRQSINADDAERDDQGSQKRVRQLQNTGESFVQKRPPMKRRIDARIRLMNTAYSNMG